MVLSSAFRLVVFSGLLLVGCHAKESHSVNENVYHPITQNPRDISVFTDAPNRPYQVIAVVDSFLSVELTREVKRNQLIDLQNKAAEAGADGLVEVEALEENRTGMVIDPTLPTGNWKQGDFGLVFLRAKAVRFQQEPEWEDRKAAEATLGIDENDNLVNQMNLDSLVVKESPKIVEPDALPAY